MEAYKIQRRVGRNSFLSLRINTNGRNADMPERVDEPKIKMPVTYSSVGSELLTASFL